MDGFDAGDYLIKGWAASSMNTGNASPATRFGSGRWASNPGNGYQLSASRYLGANIAVTSYIGFAVAHNSVDNTQGPVIFLYGDSGTVNHIQIRLFANSITVYRGGTLIASGVISMSQNIFGYIEIATLVADAGGSLIIRFNGVEVINFSGDTRNGGTLAGIDTLGLGCSSVGTSIVYIDDMYVLDSTGSAPYNNFLGDVRVYMLNPTGAGTNTQWAPDTGSNYARVNEVPYSAANYVQSGTSGQRDTYTMADLPGSGMGTIYGVQTNIIAKKTDAGSIAIKPTIISGGTTYYGTAKLLATNDTIISDIRTQDPNTSSSWTTAGVNALEAGMEVA